MIIIAENDAAAASINKTISTRQEISLKYCKEKGWPTDPEQLSFDQILEIRALPEWIKAGL